MAIRAIDKQIMIARSPDIARDVSEMQKRPEIAQDFLAQMEKVKAAQELTKVKKAHRVEMETIQSDVNSTCRNGYVRKRVGSGFSLVESGKFYHELPDAPGNNIIDITI